MTNIATNSKAAQAQQWTADPADQQVIAWWLYQAGVIPYKHNDSIIINGCRVDIGHWVVRIGNQFEIYLTWSDLTQKYHTV